MLPFAGGLARKQLCSCKRMKEFFFAFHPQILQKGLSAGILAGIEVLSLLKYKHQQKFAWVFHTEAAYRGVCGKSSLTDTITCGANGSLKVSTPFCADRQTMPGTRRRWKLCIYNGKFDQLETEDTLC